MFNNVKDFSDKWHANSALAQRHQLTTTIRINSLIIHLNHTGVSMTIVPISMKKEIETDSGTGSQIMPSCNLPTD